MKMTIDYAKGILATLPIGYYLGRDIPCSIDENAENSCFLHTEQKIIVAYNQIKEGCENTDNPELIVRSLLYHEISHAILTPQTRLQGQILNTFEDERIETLLFDYYMGVDFWAARLALNGFNSIEELKNLPITTDFQKFYALVRFRIGPKNFLDRVDKIIEEYKDLQWGSYMDDSNWRVYHYEQEIWQLYNDYCKNPPSDDELENMKSGKTKDSDVKNSQKGKGSGNGSLSLKDISLTTTPQYDPALKETIERIFEEFHSRTSFAGGATCGYSGIINPRLCSRDDYRYFLRKSQKGGMNGFSKFNLNLFIDDSGSFHSSKKIVNDLLTVLIEVEKNNPDFSLTLIKCGEGQEIVKDNRQIDCDDGTILTDDIHWQFPQVQKAGYVNYNILLYDGSATNSKNEKNYKVFNTPNTAIIIDTEDSNAVKKYCQQARKIIVKNDYAEHLIENIINTLKIALR